MLRRTVLKLLPAAGIAGFWARTAAQGAPALCHVDRLIQDLHATPVDTSGGRRYRAQAHVSLLGVPIFTRADVGGGYAIVEHASTASGETTALQFGAGSLPERTRGLNRLGFIQEVIASPAGGRREAAYFGFMTASPEKNLDQARKALESGAGATQPYTAVQGVLRENQLSNVLQRMHLPAAVRWPNYEAVAMEARHAFLAAEPPVAQALPAGTATFLSAIRGAMLQEQPRSEHRIVHNGKLYALTSEIKADPQAGQEFLRKSLTRNPAAIRVLSGTIVESGKDDRSAFRAWFETGDALGLPIRFEFRPRSFLRLTFEADASLSNPPLPFLLARSRS